MNATKLSCETEYDFALIVSGVVELTPAIEDALFEAGCDDATVSKQYGRLYIDSWKPLRVGCKINNYLTLPRKMLLRD